MAELTFGNYRLSVDVEKTRAYYAAHPLPWLLEEKNPYC